MQTTTYWGNSKQDIGRIIDIIDFTGCDINRIPY